MSEVAKRDVVLVKDFRDMAPWTMAYTPETLEHLSGNSRVSEISLFFQLDGVRPTDEIQVRLEWEILRSQVVTVGSQCRLSVSIPRLRLPKAKVLTMTGYKEVPFELHLHPEGASGEQDTSEE